MRRKIAIIGATGGLGKEICFKFAKGEMDMIFLGRNKKKMQELAEEVKKEHPTCEIDFVEIDLTDMDSVKIACEKLLKMNFDTLVLNAGVYNVPRFITKTGYENVFQVNFVSQYFLARKTLEHFNKIEKAGKIVAVGSVAYNYSKLDENDVDFRTRKKASKVYGNSKRFLMFSLYELFKNEQNVKLSVVHPGVTLTQMTNHYPKWINWLVKVGIKIFFPSPKKASENIVRGVFDECSYFEWIGPKILNVWGGVKKSKLKVCEKEAKYASMAANEIYKKI